MARFGMCDAGDEARLDEVLAVARELERAGRLAECRGFMQHGEFSVYAHVVHVALESLRLVDRHGWRLDRAALVRGALLHDYFLYDWHEPQPNDPLGISGYTHPWTALRNAEQDFELSPRERNIIVRHMWPLTPIPPACREAWVVTLADKICALRETAVGHAPAFLAPRLPTWAVGAAPYVLGR